MKVFKGKRKLSHLIMEMGVQCHFHCLLHASLLISCDPSRAANLVHSLFMRLLKGKLREEIRSSANYLSALACTERTNRLGRVLCDQQFERCA